MKYCFAVLLANFSLAQMAGAVEVIEPGVFVTQALIVPSIYWLDNDNLLISGVKKERSAIEQPGTRLLHYILSTNTLSDLGSLGGGLCASNEQVRFWRPTPETQGKPLSQQHSQWVAGSISALTLTDPPPQSAPPPRQDPLRGCKYPHEETNPPWLESAQKAGRIFQRLRADHGWMEMGYAVLSNGEPDTYKNMHPIRIYPPNNPEGFPVSGLEQIDVRPLWPYYAFKGAYLLQEDARRQPEVRGYVRSWWLYPDGRLETALQYDRAIRKGDSRWWDNKIIPTRSGFLMIYRPDYGGSLLANMRTGLYRFRSDGNFTKVLAGSIEQIVVSPDGCRLALGVDDTYRVGWNPQVLKFIDVCNE